MLLLLDQPTEADAAALAPRKRVRRRTCPLCAKGKIYRPCVQSWLGWRVFSTTGIRAYQCMTCWHRFLGVSGRG